MQIFDVTKQWQRFASSSREQRFLTVAGLVLLVAWAVFWGVSIDRDKLVNSTWVPRWHWLGCDFEHNYYSSRVWLAGGDPYQGFPRRNGGEDKYVYPPTVLALYSWCGLVSRQTGHLIWFGTSALIAMIAAIAAWKARLKLGNWPIPLPFALASILVSYPILFEMERGNCNLLVLAFLLLALWAMRRTSPWTDSLAGTLLAVATWVKIYPGILILAVVALRRWRVATVFAALGLAIGLANIPGNRAFAVSLAAQSNITPDNMGQFFPNSHTITGSWKLVSKQVPLLAKLPRWVGWAVIIMPMTLWVSYRIWQSPRRAEMAYPYCLWLIAAGTFLPTGANDYNLFFLPLAALIVWDRRDPVAIHLLMALMLLWWQPFRLPIEAEFTWVCKIVAVHAVGISLVRRAAESSAAIRQTLPAHEVAIPITSVAA